MITPAEQAQSGGTFVADWRRRGALFSLVVDCERAERARCGCVHQWRDKTKARFSGSVYLNAEFAAAQFLPARKRPDRWPRFDYHREHDLSHATMRNWRSQGK